MGRRGKSFFLVAAVMTTALFVSNECSAAASDIVITEIAAYEKSDHEWIEVFNKGGEAVDITGWKFFEDGTNHSLKAFRGDLVIEPGEHAVIADVAANTAADYPSFAGTLIDSSWGTLNESGELIGMKNASGEFVEQFTYLLTKDHSLERKDAASTDFSASNWQEHATGNTIGLKNSNTPSPEPTPSPAPTPSPEPAPPIENPSLPAPELPSIPTSTPPVATSTPPIWQPQPGDILINEFVADPGDNEKEWIELYNTAGHSVDLTDWTIEEGSKSTTRLSGSIGAKDAARFFVVEGVLGSLNNTGDLIILRNIDRVIIDTVAYGSWDDGNTLNNAPSAHDPNSVARISDGANTRNAAYDFQVTAKPTKGASNILQKPEVPVRQKSGSTVVISELVPNPATRSADDEYIELANIGTQAIDLSDWELINEQGTRYRLDPKDFTSLTLQPGGFVVVPRSISNLSLKNAGGDSVRLYEPDADTPQTRLSYKESAPAGSAYARNANGRYQWTETPTPNAGNIITRKNAQPFLVADIPAKGAVGSEIIFDATDTTDPDMDPLAFEWDFGDTHGSRDALARHSYAKAGTFHGSLTVRDALHAAVKKFKVAIAKQADRQSEQSIPTALALAAPENAALKVPLDLSAVRLNEIFPNPKGADTREFVELKNTSNHPIDLFGFVLRSGKHELWKGAGTALLPKEIFVIDSKLLARQLINTKDTLTLRAPDGGSVESVEYEDPPDGQSLSKSSAGNWLWSARPSEGEENDVDYYDAPAGEEEMDFREEHEDADRVLQSDVKSSEKTRAKSARVYLEGVVSTPLGALGKNILYIAGATNTQVYVGTHPIPSVAIGDEVAINGVRSERNGETRIRLDAKATFHVIGKKVNVSPRALDIADIDESERASLVQVKGDVTEAKWPYVTLNDGNDEVQVMFKRSAGFSGMPLREGAHATVSGIVLKAQSGYKIVPRAPSDVAIDRTKKLNTATGENRSTSKTRSAILAGALAIAVIAGGLFIQNLKK